MKQTLRLNLGSQSFHSLRHVQLVCRNYTPLFHGGGGGDLPHQ